MSGEPSRDRLSLAVWNVAKCDRALGDRVGERTPGIHELVKVQMKRPEQGPNHGPVQLLAEEREVHELAERGLKLVPGCFALVRLFQDREVARGCG